MSLGRHLLVIFALIASVIRASSAVATTMLPEPDPFLPVERAPHPCPAVFQTPLSSLGPVPLPLGSDLKATGRRILPIGPKDQVEIVRHSDPEESFDSFVMRRTGRIVLGRSEATLEEYQSNRQAWLALTHDLVEFVVDNKEDRRGLSPEFRPELHRTARIFAPDSYWFWVQDRATGRKLGAVQLVVAPYGIKDGLIVPEGPTVDLFHYRSGAGFRNVTMEEQPDPLLLRPRPPSALPKETYLNARLYRGLPASGKPETGIVGGLHIEIRHLMIDHRQPIPIRSRVWMTLWSHMARTALSFSSPRMRYFQQSYFALADRTMAVDYAIMGLLPLVVVPSRVGTPGNIAAPEKLTSHRTGPGRVFPITRKDDIDWVSMIFPPHRMEHLNRLLLFGLAPQMRRASPFAPLLGAAEGERSTPVWRAAYLLDLLSKAEPGSTQEQVADLHRKAVNAILAAFESGEFFLQSPEHSRGLVELALEDTLPFVRQSTLDLIEGLNSRNVAVRLVSARVLGTIFEKAPRIAALDAERILEGLVAATRDEDPGVAEQALSSIAGYREALPESAPSRTASALLEQLRTTNGIQRLKLIPLFGAALANVVTDQDRRLGLLTLLEEIRPDDPVAAGVAIIALGRLEIQAREVGGELALHSLTHFNGPDVLAFVLRSLTAKALEAMGFEPPYPSRSD